MKPTYIYVLKCPISKDIRYVGKTISPKRRYNCHLSPKKATIKTPIGRWVKKLQKSGLRPIMEILETCESNWESREKYWILFYRGLGKKLCNLTEGGEGVCGILRSKETRLKISINNAKATAKRVYQFSKDGILLNEYESISVAAKITRLRQDKISRCALGKMNRCGDFIWSYDKTFKPIPISSRARSIYQLDLNGNILREYLSLESAEKSVGQSRNNIRKVCTGNQKSAGGFKWAYKTHSHSNNKRQLAIPVLMCKPDGTPIKRYESLGIAEKYTGIKKSRIGIASSSSSPIDGFLFKRI